jgi:hypothetical protein
MAVSQLRPYDIEEWAKATALLNPEYLLQAADAWEVAGQYIVTMFETIAQKVQLLIDEKNWVGGAAEDGAKPNVDARLVQARGLKTTLDAMAADAKAGYELLANALVAAQGAIWTARAATLSVPMNDLTARATEATYAIFGEDRVAADQFAATHASAINNAAQVIVTLDGLITTQLTTRFMAVQGVKFDNAGAGEPGAPGTVDPAGGGGGGGEVAGQGGQAGGTLKDLILGLVPDQFKDWVKWIMDIPIPELQEFLNQGVFQMSPDKFDGLQQLMGSMQGISGENLKKVFDSLSPDMQEKLLGAFNMASNPGVTSPAPPGSKTPGQGSPAQLPKVLQDALARVSGGGGSAEDGGNSAASGIDGWLNQIAERIVTAIEDMVVSGGGELPPAAGGETALGEKGQQAASALSTPPVPAAAASETSAAQSQPVALAPGDYILEGAVAGAVAGGTAGNAILPGVGTVVGAGAGAVIGAAGALAAGPGR